MIKTICCYILLILSTLNSTACLYYLLIMKTESFAGMSFKIEAIIGISFLYIFTVWCIKDLLIGAHKR